MNLTPRRMREIRDEVRQLHRAGSSTLAMARLRHEASGSTYRPGEFHHRLGKECDRFVSSCLMQSGVWTAVNAPPRHGKTDLIGRAMPAKALLQDPAFTWLYGTSTSQRAEEVSLAVRRVVEWLHNERGVAHLAPGDKWSATEWRTVGGGGWVGVGVGQPTGGIGARGLILDDTTGSAARARSAAFRREQREWMQEDMFSRLMGGGGLFHMETRRGLEDGHAWLVREFGDHVREMNWPLVFEAQDVGNPHDWRAVGDYLWPAADGHINFGAEWHALHPEVRGRLLEKLYQGRPLPGEDTMWDEEWLINTYIGWPYDQWALCSRRALFVDGAATDGRGDHTVISHLGELRGQGQRIVKLGQDRGQWGYPKLEARLEAAIESCRPKGGHPCRFDVYLENNSNTRAALQALQKKYPRLGIQGINVSGQGSKQDRWRSTLGAYAGGAVLGPEPRYGVGLGTKEDKQGGGSSWVPGWRTRMLRLEDRPGDQVDDEADADTMGIREFMGLGAKQTGPAKFSKRRNLSY